MVLSLRQPWATLWVYGEKMIETRGWSTSYRGPIAVHAGKHFDDDCRHLCFTEPFLSALRRCGINHPGALPHGALLGRVDLTECRRMKPAADGYQRDRRLTEKERAFGNYAEGRFAWMTADDRLVLREPIPMRGGQGLRYLSAEMRAKLASAPAIHLDPHATGSGGKPADREDRDPPTPGQQPESRLPDDDDS